MNTHTRPDRNAHRATPLARLAPLLALLATATLLQACGRNDQRTVGQKVDNAVAMTEQKAGEMKADARDAGRDARQAVGNAADSVADKTKDVAITAEVKGKLAGDAQLSALAINVDTTGGKVVLRGVAPDTASRSRASDLALTVNGVSSVDNELSVQAR